MELLEMYNSAVEAEKAFNNQVAHIYEVEANLELLISTLNDDQNLSAEQTATLKQNILKFEKDLEAAKLLARELLHTQDALWNKYSHTLEEDFIRNGICSTCGQKDCDSMYKEILESEHIC